MKPIEKIYKTPSGFVPITMRPKFKNKVEVKFARYKYGVRQNFMITDRLTKSYKLPKGTKLISGQTIERGITPSKFKLKLAKVF
jgi:hypothetical protein